MRSILFYGSQSKTMSKRKRTENWTASDKSILRKLCAEKINIIENKCVDTDTNRLKRECWIQITNAFNCVSETKRDVIRIQFQWRNMKMKAKAAESAYQKAISKTGGDGPPPQSISKEERELMDLMSNEFKIEKHEYDSDGGDRQIKSENVSVDILDGFTDDYKDNEFEKDYFSENNQSQDNASVNRSSMHPSTKKKQNKRKGNDCEAYQKKVLFELTKAHIIEEHEERMAILALEKQCRLKELEKLELEIELLPK